jgi:hypothetical protein
MTDRYTKAVLTLIATALVYLCVVLTPLPTAHAQFTQRPGEPTGPVQVVVVGWRAPQSEAVPVSVSRPVAVTVNGLVEVRGQVKTEKANDRAERVILSGWEEDVIHRDNPGTMRVITAKNSGLPVNVK